MSFPKCVTMTKNTHFFPILHVFAPLNNVREYIAWSWKTTLIMWFFCEDDIQLQIQVHLLGMYDPSLVPIADVAVTKRHQWLNQIFIFYPVVQFRFSLRESNLIATIAITIGFNERNWFSYVDAAQIITRIDSLILVKFAALFTRTSSEKSTKLCIQKSWPVMQYTWETWCNPVRLACACESSLVVYWINYQWTSSFSNHMPAQASHSICLTEFSCKLLGWFPEWACRNIKISSSCWWHFVTATSPRGFQHFKLN